MLGFMISEDLVGANPIMVHNEDCWMAKKRKPVAETMKWHGPFEDHNNANSTAESISSKYKKGWRNCERCMTKL